jgi:two-component system cell cycle response regulator
MEITGRRKTVLRAAQLATLAGLAAFTVHAAFNLGGHGLDSFARDWLYDALIVASAVFCVTRGVLVRAERAAWLMLGLGLASWSAGEIYYSSVLAGQHNAPYPSISDALQLGFYPATYIALGLLIRPRVREYGAGVWLDGVIGALAVGALGCAVLVEAVLKSTGGTPLTVATDLAYPICDVLLLALVIGAMAVTGWELMGRAWTLLAAGLVATAVADGVFLVQSASDSYVQGTVLDALWPAATLLVGYAAWHKPRRQRAAPVAGWRLLVFPVAFALTAVGLFVYDHSHPLNDAASVLAALTLLAVLARMGMTFGENLRMLKKSRHDALTDALTGLGNRRKLLDDLRVELASATETSPRLLMLFDLDGFKDYNDAFGHPAGDALLARLGDSFETAVSPYGKAYRLGGDEFCALVAPSSPDNQAPVAAATAALSEQGDGFQVGASVGTTLAPEETQDPEYALQLADRRLYDNKNGGRRRSASQQTRDVLLQTLRERVPDLSDHLNDVTRLAVAVSRRMQLDPDELNDIARAAELHDIGKVSVPDAILEKPGPLDDRELAVVRQHPIVAERILSAAPAMVAVAKMVRASHERFDGTGYPDGLAGDEIPLGARIIAVCDAFHAMTTSRSYHDLATLEEALGELRRCAGTQFDPLVVDAFVTELRGANANVRLPQHLALDSLSLATETAQ